ncbi:hypothetical protein OG21DRAFT_1513021 [Imleria badia]|nr:hypothetical protein OG21DRAFT_1513021 [Imleria badia]
MTPLFVSNLCDSLSAGTIETAAFNSVQVHPSVIDIALGIYASWKPIACEGERPTF